MDGNVGKGSVTVNKFVIQANGCYVRRFFRTRNRIAGIDLTKNIDKAEMLYSEAEALDTCRLCKDLCEDCKVVPVEVVYNISE